MKVLHIPPYIQYEYIRFLEEEKIWSNV